MIAIHLKIPELLHMLSLVHRCALKRVCRQLYSREIFYEGEEGFFCVYIASSKHSGIGENSQKLCKPSSASCVCITVLSSPWSTNLVSRVPLPSLPLEERPWLQLVYWGRINGILSIATEGKRFVNLSFRIA